MMKHNLRPIALLLACAMLLLAACSDDDTDEETEEPEETEAAETTAEPEETESAELETTATGADGEPQYGGSVTVWRQEFQNNFDPSSPTFGQDALFYESLWAIDWSLDDPDVFSFNTTFITADYRAGQLAESWVHDEAEATFTVQLREDVYYQTKQDSQYDIFGGRQFVAEDVKWAYDRLLGLGSGWDEPIESDNDWTTVLYMIESVEAADEFTVVFHLKADSNTDIAVNDLMCANVNVIGPEWDELTEEEQSDWRYLSGTGPYILDEYVPDSYMHFVRNDDYYCYDERYPENKLPYLDEVTLTLIGESANRLTQFVSGGVDFLEGTNPLGTSEIAQLRDSLDEDEYAEYIVTSSPISIGLKQTFEPFQDIRVRQAMNLAVNTQEIHTSYYGLEGEAQIMGLFDSNTDYSSVDEWDEDVYNTYAGYDPERAVELLEEAGYGDGFTFTCVIFGALDIDLFTLVQSYLADVGITMELEVGSSPAEMDAVGDDPDNPASVFFTGGKSLIRDAVNNFASDAIYNRIYHGDTDFDELIYAANNAETLSDSIEAAKGADTYFAEQYWLLMFGGAEEQSDFVSGRVQGYSGERTTQNFNLKTVMARIWVED